MDNERRQYERALRRQGVHPLLENAPWDDVIETGFLNGLAYIALDLRNHNTVQLHTNDEGNGFSLSFMSHAGRGPGENWPVESWAEAVEIVGRWRALRLLNP